MNENESIIEKIRGLLRLAKSDNAHEATLAMQRALEIASKHRIDLSAISPDDDQNKLIGDHLDLPSRLAHEWKEALNIAHGYFNVNVTVLIGMSSKRALIVGTKLDIELASYVTTFLVRSCRQCLASWKKTESARRRKTTGAKTQSFVKGYFWGIRDGLRKQQEAVAEANGGYQLMLDNGRAARDAASKEFTQDCGPSRSLAVPDARRNRAALWSGFQQGLNTELRPGLRDNAPLALE